MEKDASTGHVDGSHFDAGIEPTAIGFASLTRRSFMGAAAIATASLLWPLRGRADSHGSSLETAMASSTLVYITPLKKDGGESACHGEVWFVSDGTDLLVVTNPERWRAAAIGKGLDRARLWVGEHGVWTRSGGSYKKSPSFVAGAALEPDRQAQAKALDAFGAKYSDGWEKWGPRFKNGLASGERVLIRYTPVKG